MGLAMAALTVVLLSSSLGQAILPYLTLPYLTLPQAYLVRKGGAMFLDGVAKAAAPVAFRT